MEHLPLNEIIDRIKKDTNLSDKEIEKMISKKVEELSGLISKEGAAEIIANELGAKLYSIGKEDNRNKTYTDEHGYKRGKLSHSDLIHRQKAYRNIYLKNRDYYPLPFSKYVVHHIDGNKKNNRIDNLQIMLQEDHEKLHGIYKDDDVELEFNKLEKESKQLDMLKKELTGVSQEEKEFIRTKYFLNLPENETYSEKFMEIERLKQEQLTKEQKEFKQKLNDDMEKYFNNKKNKKTLFHKKVPHIFLHQEISNYSNDKIKVYEYFFTSLNERLRGSYENHLAFYFTGAGIMGFLYTLIFKPFNLSFIWKLLVGIIIGIAVMHLLYLFIALILIICYWILVLIGGIIFILSLPFSLILYLYKYLNKKICPKKTIPKKEYKKLLEKRKQKKSK